LTSAVTIEVTSSPEPIPAELRIACPAPEDELLLAAVLLLVELVLDVNAESRELKLPVEDVALVVMMIVSVKSGPAG
jgi:hypothetical protein